MSDEQQRAGPGTGYFLGAVLLGLSWYFWPHGQNVPAALDGRLFGIFMGGSLVLAGAARSLRNRDIRRAKQAAMKPTGAYGRAAFAKVADCAAAGLTDPAGLFLGMLDSTPIFHKDKGHC